MIPPANGSHLSGQEAITLTDAVAQLASTRGIDNASGEIQYVSHGEEPILDQGGAPAELYAR